MLISEINIISPYWIILEKESCGGLYVEQGFFSKLEIVPELECCSKYLSKEKIEKLKEKLNPNGSYYTGMLRIKNGAVNISSLKENSNFDDIFSTEKEAQEELRFRNLLIIEKLLEGNV